MDTVVKVLNGLQIRYWTLGDSYYVKSSNGDRLLNDSTLKQALEFANSYTNK